MIGVFDSGLGGLTAVRALRKIKPSADIVYLGDTARLPYGSKSRETITAYALEGLDFLLRRGITSLVVACGSMSANALDAIEAASPVPVTGVVTPAARAAVAAAKNGKLGVIATSASINSGAYARAARDIDPAVEVFQKACPLFVPMVEEGRFSRGDRLIEMLVGEYLAPLKNAGISSLLLGCTHYPLLKDVIGDYLGGGVALIDSGETAVNALDLSKADGKGGIEFCVTDEAGRFSELAQIFLEKNLIVLAQRVDICRD